MSSFQTRNISSFSDSQLVITLGGQVITTDDLKPGHPAHTVPLPDVDLGSPWITSRCLAVDFLFFWGVGRDTTNFRKRLRLIIGNRLVVNQYNNLFQKRIPMGS